MNKSEPIRIAVVTGGHPYNVPEFFNLFRSMEDVEAYIQHVDDFTSSSQEIRDSYKVVLFYQFLMETPLAENQPWYKGNPHGALVRLSQTGQGILLLHHAILSYPNWPYWSDLTGIENRQFDYSHDETVTLAPVGSDHPIIEGVKPWTMTDETFDMNDAAEDSEILLTTGHPKSLRTIAWTRQVQNARVFSLISGHDEQAWNDPNFQRVLHHGIMWAAERL